MEIHEESNRLTILRLLNMVERRGMQGLKLWLEKGSDYFTAPASTRFHLSVPGGLAQHHLNVYRALRDMNGRFKLRLSRDTMILVGLLHDVCKCGMYYEVGNTYRYNKGHPEGHATLSIEWINEHIKLDEQEEMMIRFHMGTYSIFDRDGYPTVGEVAIDMHRAIAKFPAVQIFAACDMGASIFESNNY